MTFLNTQPSVFEDPAETETWMNFRVDDPHERSEALRELMRGEIPLVIGAPGQSAMSATLWSMDGERGRLHFALDPACADPYEVMGEHALWAAGYIGPHKVQFVLPDPQLSEDAYGRWRFNSAYTTDFYRMPRRCSLRMRRSSSQAARAHMHDPDWPHPGRPLIVLDISEGGCALFLPSSMTPPAAGSRLNQVEIELDNENFIFTDLVVQNLQRAARGSHRVGCRWDNMPHGAGRTLASWLERGRLKRMRLLLVLD